MKNRPVIVDEREYWISRSVAVSCVVFAKNNDGELCVLINKRGTALFNPGKWNIPGGFIDYDENAEQCAKREVYEETGVDLSNNKWKVSGSWSYKYGIFDLIHVYKIFDWENDIMVVYGG